MDSKIRLSLVIPAKDLKCPKLVQLIRSINAQDFPKDQMEVLVITEGTSESAKAIGIRRAKGNVIGFLSSDNELIEKDFLSEHYRNALFHGAAHPRKYHHYHNDDILNRYFALIGGNDPLSYYMGKNDRASYLPEDGFNLNGSIGDNGYFVTKSLIEKTDLDNYYHVDNAIESGALTVAMPYTIWHKTGGNIFGFFKKRYSYGLQHAFNKNRRWHLVDFKKPGDVWKLAVFIFFSLTLIQPLFLSMRGYLKVKDKAWFLHPIVCVGTVFTYALLTAHLTLRNLRSQLLSAPMAVRRA